VVSWTEVNSINPVVCQQVRYRILMIHLPYKCIVTSRIKSVQYIKYDFYAHNLCLYILNVNIFSYQIKCVLWHIISLQISIKAAHGGGVGITGFMFWDGPANGINTYDYTEDEDWTVNICQCCLMDVILEVCKIYHKYFKH